MPVLRRLLAAKVTRAQRLADLHALRQELQLKHLLAMLAVELGYAGWVAWKYRAVRKLEREFPPYPSITK